MKWFPIQNPPPYGEEVLLYCHGHITIGRLVTPYKGAEPRWADGFKALDPTHWAPLPEGPE